ncbi:MAG TPA: CapA family protein [Burkholderiales bacterium]|nr:CapA family protein [Burkholderiales bacterium]
MSELILMGCGDVGPIHAPMSKYTTLAKPVLAQADIRFAQVERVYSERGSLQLHSGDSHSRVAPELASIFSDCGFDVVSVASNHAMDWGPDALLDTVELLRKQGIRAIGAGRNLAEAREPAIVEKNGTRVAFLAYCSVLREGYAAGPNKPGVAPLRVHTYYEPSEYQAGMPPRIVTIPYEEDLAGVVQDVAAAKKSADVVVVILHWGLHFIPKMVADYQPAAAKAILKAGADMIVGHHAHVPKAIGMHDGKACFYSVSNFIMSAPAASEEKKRMFERKYGVKMDPDYPHLPYGSDAKKSLIAKAVIKNKRIERVSFLPVLIDRELRPEVLRAGDARFDDIVRYMDWASEDFDHRFRIEGDEVVVEARA